MSTQVTTTTGQYLSKAREFETLSKTLPTMGAGDVLIAPRSTTLCGSDIHYFQHGRNGTIEIREPLCLGHEFSGVVVDVGPGVTDRKVGDRVAVEPGVACGQCDFCAAGRYNLCTKLRFRGSGSAWPHFQGGLQSKVIHPAIWTHKLPDSLSLEEGALLEPLAVAVHACRRAGIKQGSSCTIIGAGAVGLLCAVAARLEGCKRVAIADIVETRVKFATEKGFADAGFVAPATRYSDPQEQLRAARSIASSLGGIKYEDGAEVGRSDFVFECTGVEICVQSSIYATKTGGKTVLVGMGTPNHLLPLSDAGAREIDIISVWRYANCYPRAIEIMQRSQEGGTVPKISQIITHRFDGLGSVPAALQRACTSQDEVGGIVIKVAVGSNSDS